jgi:DNA topoisomerase-1
LTFVIVLGYYAAMITHLTLVIVESPKKAKTMLGYFPENVTILASCGHVRRLPRKNGSILPDQDFKMIWEENPNII